MHMQHKLYYCQPFCFIVRNTKKCENKITSLEKEMQETEAKRESLKEELTALEEEAQKVIEKQEELRVSIRWSLQGNFWFQPRADLLMLKIFIFSCTCIAGVSKAVWRGASKAQARSGGHWSWRGISTEQVNGRQTWTGEVRNETERKPTKDKTLSERGTCARTRENLVIF